MSKSIIFFIITFFLIAYTPHGGHNCTDASDYAKMINSNSKMILKQKELTTNDMKKIQNIKQYFKSIQSYSNKCDCNRAYHLAKEGQKYCNNITNIKNIKTLHIYMEHIKSISEGIISYCEICDN